jgi:simple sugar transport system permease protein
LFIWIILNKTTFGFKLKSVGLSPVASRYAGINVERKLTQSMMIAGSLSGLAGALHVMGVSKNVAILAAHEGYGFDGIAVALIGSSTPLGSLFAGLFLGTLKYSGQKIQSALGAPSEVILIMIGTIIFFISIPNFWRKKS